MKMNNLRRKKKRLGEWINSQDLEAENAIIWPARAAVAESLEKDAEIDNIVGLAPSISYEDEIFGENIDTEAKYSHNYTGQTFDLEYGWAIADSALNTLKSQINPPENLYTYDYPDHKERDKALENAFNQITETSERLLKENNSTAVYNLKNTGRYRLPQLDEDPKQNQVEYADRIATRLEHRGFNTEILEDPEFSGDVHLVGKK